MNTHSDVAKVLFELVREGFEPRFGELADSFPCNDLWRALGVTGTKLWLDTGDLEAARTLWTSEMEGLTTNNTLLNVEIQKGIYDGVVPQIAAAIRAADGRLPEDEVVLEIAFALNAIHALKLVEIFDAHVSVELHTALAQDVERTISYARRFYEICPDRFIIKIPLTPAGLLAARRVRLEGIPVNFTLGFAARQNYVIARIAQPTYCNVFMGRLNAYAAAEGLCDGRFVGEKATLASQRALEGLRSQGVGTLQIGASMRGGSQVSDLAGLDVFTMPVKVAREFLDAGLRPEEVTSRREMLYEPHYAAGVDPAAEGLDHLWSIDEATREAVDSLGAVDELEEERLLAMGALELQEHFHDRGAGGLFPRWSAEDLQGLQGDGKLPARARWRERVGAGEIGLDALFTAAGLLSFTRDQAALDERIRSLI